jgi:hypothetical protein
VNACLRHVALQGLLRYAAILAGQLRYREAIQLVRRAELTSSDQSEAEFIAQVLSDLTVIGAAGFCHEKNSRRACLACFSLDAAPYFAANQDDSEVGADDEAGPMGRSDGEQEEHAEPLIGYAGAARPLP